MLTHAVSIHWHAVVRDVLSLGYQIRDIFTTLGLEEMLAIVIAAPPQSSLRHFLDEGWSREAHLLANLSEKASGVSSLNGRYERPGVPPQQIDPARLAPDGSELFRGDVMTWDEMDEMDAKWSGVAGGKATVRKW